MSILRSINEGFERRYGKLIDDRKQKEVKECDGECKDKKAEKELTEAPIYGLEAQHDSRKSFGGKAQVDVKKSGDDVLYSYGTPVCKVDARGKVTLYPRWDESMTTLRHVKEFLLQHGKKAESKKQIGASYEIADEFLDEGCKGKNKPQLSETYKVVDKDGKKVPQGGGFTSRKEAEMFASQYGKAGLRVVSESADEGCKGKKVSTIKEYKDMGQDLGEYQKWVDYDMKRYHKISDKTMDKIKKAGLTVVKDQYGDYEVIAHEPVRECDDKEAKRRAIVKEAVEKMREKRLSESKKQK